MGLGSLPLQEFSQQPLHLPVSGVCTFHRLLCVKTDKMAQLQYGTKEGIERGERKKERIPNFNLVKAKIWNGELQTCLPGVEKPSCAQSSDQTKACNDHRRTVFVNWTA